MYKIFKDADSVAEYVGKKWREYQASSKNGFFVSSPLSSTPLPLYRWVIKNADSFQNWKRFRFILMDEQLNESASDYIASTDSSSYEKFCRGRLLDPLQRYVDLNNVILKPNIHNFDKFEGLIREHGGIDLLILAIGARGHYAQVMPGTSLETGFHIAKLLPEFIEAHTKKGGSYEGATFREYGMSLGPRQVLTAKQIIVIVTGESKSDLARQLCYYDSFNPEFPISIIHHPEVRGKAEIVLSEDAGKLLRI